MTEGLVLASASTVRAWLLAATGVNFRIEPAELDKGFLKQACRAERRDAADCALALAEAKARQVAARLGRAVVIGADPLLVCGEVWFDKPADLGQARTQLQALRSRTLEGRGVQLFEHIEGDYFGILGLPLMELLGFLRSKGIILS